MRNRTNKQNFIAAEAYTLYVVHTYFAVDPIYHEIFRDYIWRAYGINLDLCPREVIDHCEWLKDNLERLYYHYKHPDRTDTEHVAVLDKIIAELSE